MGYESRYFRQDEIKDKTGSRVYSSTLYPNKEDVDGLTTLSYNLKQGQRLDQLAEDIYGKSELWWIIPTFNTFLKPSLVASKTTKITLPDPSQIDSYLRELDELNKKEE